MLPRLRRLCGLALMGFACSAAAAAAAVAQPGGAQIVVEQIDVEAGTVMRAINLRCTPRIPCVADGTLHLGGVEAPILVRAEILPGYLVLRILAPGTEQGTVRHLSPIGAPEGVRLPLGPDGVASRLVRLHEHTEPPSPSALQDLVVRRQEVPVAVVGVRAMPSP
jgi:hypothetical protein